MGIGNVQRALGRGRIDELMTVLGSAVPVVTTQSLLTSDSFMYSSSKNCPNVWPFCNVWVITQW